MQSVEMLYFLFNKKKEKREERRDIIRLYNIQKNISFFGYYSLFYKTLWIKAVFFFNFQFDSQTFIFCDLALLNPN
jgi:hypothetical protein